MTIFRGESKRGAALDFGPKIGRGLAIGVGIGGVLDYIGLDLSHGGNRVATWEFRRGTAPNKRVQRAGVASVALLRASAVAWRGTLVLAQGLSGPARIQNWFNR